MVPPSGPFSDAVLTLAVVWLLATPIGIVFRKGERRAFWVGAATFGWGYLLVVHDRLMRVVGTGEDLLHAYTALLLAIAGGTLARWYFWPTEKNKTD